MTTFTTSVTADVNMKTEALEFGWFKTLDEVEMNSYTSSIGQALLNADNGEAVHWNRSRAWGLSRVLYTDTNSQGWCRTLYIEVNAFNKKASDTKKFCYDKVSKNWSEQPMRR